MRRRTALTVMTLGLLVAAPVPTRVALAHGDSEKSDVRARLDPCCGEPEPEADGKARRKTKMEGTILLRGRFKAKVEVPIPSAGLGIADATAAAAADIRLILSRAGTAYAECHLALAEIESEESEEEGVEEAEFKVVVRQRLGRPLRLKKGACDLDLATADVQAGIPAVEAGDVARATLVVDPLDRTQDVDFLEGTFEEH